MVASTLARLATSGALSAPAGAPIFSASLPEARARSRQFFREVRREREQDGIEASRARPPARPTQDAAPDLLRLDSHTWSPALRILEWDSYDYLLISFL